MSTTTSPIAAAIAAAKMKRATTPPVIKVIRAAKTDPAAVRRSIRVTR